MSAEAETSASRLVKKAKAQWKAGGLQLSKLEMEELIDLASDAAELGAAFKDWKLHAEPKER